MACKYAVKKDKTRAFMKKVPDSDLFARRTNHEKERSEYPWSHGAGSLAQGARLIWMREVRTQIRERRLKT